MAEKILHLTLKEEWFDMIVTGEKTIEFREVKPHWIKRLKDKTFDEVHFRNGYKKDSPFMRVECQRIIIRTPPPHEPPYTDEKVYCIYLGEILEVKNWVVNDKAIQ